MKKFIPPQIKQLFAKLMKSNSSTQEVADGLAIGVFIAFLPIMGIQMYVSLLLTRLFRKNSIVAMIAAWITNPFTAVPIYLFNFWIGAFFYENSINLNEIKTLLANLTLKSLVAAGQDFLIPLWIGSLIIGIFMAFISQKLCLKYYSRIQKRFHDRFHQEEDTEHNHSKLFTQHETKQTQSKEKLGSEFFD